MPQAKAETVKRTTRRKVRQGVVVGDKAEKTIVVQVERRMTHRLYKKIIRRSKKYHVHDEDNTSKVGDVVRIMECRPLSRTKRWRLIEIVVSAQQELKPKPRAEA